jgi:hypothetical protein
MINNTGSQDTGIRVSRETKRELSLARAQMAVVTGCPVRSDDETVAKLIEHWRATMPTTVSLGGSEPCGKSDEVA